MWRARCCNQIDFVLAQVVTSMLAPLQNFDFVVAKSSGKRQERTERFILYHCLIWPLSQSSIDILGTRVSGDNLGVFVVNPLTARPMQRSMPSSAFLMPYDTVWDEKEIIVTSPKRNYTVKDYKQFFVVSGECLHPTVRTKRLGSPGSSQTIRQDTGTLFAAVSFPEKKKAKSHKLLFHLGHQFHRRLWDEEGHWSSRQVYQSSRRACSLSARSQCKFSEFTPLSFPAHRAQCVGQNFVGRSVW